MFVERLERLFERLSLVTLQKCGRDGVGKTQGAHCSGTNRPLRALLVDHDGDDLHFGIQIEQGEDPLGIGHLRHCRWRDEGDSIYMREAGGAESAQVIGLNLWRNLLRHGLPGVPRALDDLDWRCGSLRHSPGNYFRASSHSTPKPSR